MKNKIKIENKKYKFNFEIEWYEETVDSISFNFKTAKLNKPHQFLEWVKDSTLFNTKSQISINGNDFKNCLLKVCDFGSDGTNFDDCDILITFTYELFKY